ncbi:MAG: monovalent cation/H+ antiporter complex subunit F [Verrucomicrobiales bacterium]|nr:monovalent cation/H+ antiporter complex subunit F [Verrucomicrobiales bacterium]
MDSETFFIGVGLAILFLMVPAIWRMTVGPTALDRIVAVNVVGTKTAVLLVVIGQIFGQVGMFVDFALAYALLNFTGSLAAARYLHKTKAGGGHVINFEESGSENK